MEWLLPGVGNLRQYIDEEHAEENVYMVELVTFFGLLDVAMFAFMPWKKSRFYELSEGYPSMVAMKFCLCIKVLESLATMISELLYLGEYGDHASESSMALFSINVVFSILSVLVELLVLMTRGSVLKREGEKEEKEQNAKADAVDESGNVKDSVGEDGSQRIQPRPSLQTLADIYPAEKQEYELTRLTYNPLYEGKKKTDESGPSEECEDADKTAAESGDDGKLEEVASTHALETQQL